MHKSVDTPRPRPTPAPLCFGPDRRLLVVALPGALFAGLLAFVGDDPVQRFFSLVVVVVLLAVVATDLVFAPRLTVDPAGLRVFAPLDRAHVGWAELESVHASSTQRYGLRSTVLEIDAGDRLLVLDRRDLAADPWEVASAIVEYGRRCGRPDLTR